MSANVCYVVFKYDMCGDSESRPVRSFLDKSKAEECAKKFREALNELETLDECVAGSKGGSFEFEDTSERTQELLKVLGEQDNDEFNPGNTDYQVSETPLE